METYSDGLAGQSVQHYYAGAVSSPKAKTVYNKDSKSCSGGKSMACKSGKGKKGK